MDGIHHLRDVKKIVSRDRIIVFLAFVLLVTLFWFSGEIQAEFNGAVLSLGKYAAEFPLATYAIFLSLTILSTLLSPFSSVFLVPFAVAIWGSMVTFLLLLSGWVVGGIVAYFIGKYLGYEILKKILPSRFESYRDGVARKTKFWMVLLVRLVTPSETGYLFGIMRFSFFKYVVATSLSELPYAVLTVYFSSAIITQNIVAIEKIAFVLIGIAVILFYIFRKKIKGKLSEWRL